MQKIDIYISQVIGSQNAITHNFGIKVYEAISSYLKSGFIVTLSFKGIRNLSSGFCNASIGKIYSDFENAKDILIFSDITDPLWNEKIQDAIDLIPNHKLVEVQNSAISELYS